MAPDGDLLIEGGVTLAGDLTVRNLVVLEDLEVPKILAEEVNTEKLNITIPDPQPDGTSNASVGADTIVAGETEIIVETTATDKVLSITETADGEHFKVVITSPSPNDIEFDWWLVQVASAN